MFYDQFVADPPPADAASGTVQGPLKEPVFHRLPPDFPDRLRVAACLLEKIFLHSRKNSQKEEQKQMVQKNQEFSDIIIDTIKKY